ncbi:2-oxoglutarate dehydrogenase complex dihydrolipoyllysine-residue succinyltransferase [Rhizobiales bacterium]|uniref:2-oxoglutarate dehydrogenase complex dihydrolipoyllysine-residue succinyltransferase n=1 Tax=Hongsoonwoonella zoysiae TaxID=2821844 RepID=UPI00155FD1DA|nr:2-oxoglutarate dehydrogenase complex dihydrolipoyllysine-residue succinyltransferase [Hongsoonwoonella zoysiae]NRG16488.1 2-oxoglutarate dehydrogenase complex dihydrolipoyllysine-residue succinyltransferase [Hongsoonwoonella zoysiae]
MATEIRVPTLGESVTEATIAQWFKKPGEAINADEPIVELETDKVTVEVPAPASGTLEEILVKEGDTVEVGALLGQISEGEGAAKPAAAKKSDGGAAKAEKPAEAKKAASAETVDVVVPSAGESVTEAEVGEWMVKEGDTVKADDTLVELETDKAAQEIPAPQAGTVVEVLKKTGDTVQPGDILCRIAVGAGAAAAKPAASPAPAAKEETASSSSMPPAPSASKMMAEAGLSDDQVSGSGKRGQVLKGDVIAALAGDAAAKQAEAPAAKAPRAPSAAGDEGREERVRMTKLRQTIARRLKDAQNTAAMLTTYNEVDMGPVMELRKQYKDLFEKKHGVKLGFMGFFTKAVCHALKEIPAVNAEIDGTDIIYKNYCHIGVAVGTEKGLVVPVVRDADEMSIAEIEKKISEFGRKARDGKLGIDEMQGGTFTISNGGVYGSLMSSPILNAPQSGILGMHKIQERPMVVDGQIVARPMMYLALSYDHRIVDGKEAVTFLVRVKESLEDIQRLVLDL